jgi:uncharacterized protein (DUF1778 family)
MPRKQAKTVREASVRAARLGFRLDRQTKELIERAANFERRKVSDFCVTALVSAARRTIAAHETLVLSEQERKAFFDLLINPPKSSKRLVHAFAEHKRRVIMGR